MSNSSSSIEIQELIQPLGSAHQWRVDWLGAVRKPRPNQSQHTINVFFSPLRPDYKGLITAPEAADSDRQVAIELGVGYLPALHIGAVFHRGREVTPLPTQTDRVWLTISPAHFRYVPLSDLVDRHFPNTPSTTVVTPREFKVGSAAYPQAARSQNLLVADDACTDDSYVAIPSIEVARYFFCGSSLFARHLFSSGWEDLLLREHCNTEGMPDTVVVGLRNVQGLTWPHAYDLAFAIVDPLTKSCLRGIHQTMQETWNRFGQPAIECRFPLNEPVKIEAEVIRTCAKTQRGVRFFITRLIQVQRPIPFKRCFVWPQLHPQQGSNKDDPDLLPMHLPQNKKSPLGNDPSGLVVPTINNLEKLASEARAGDNLGRPMKSSGLLEIHLAKNRYPGFDELPKLAPKELQKYRAQKSDQVHLPVTGKQISTASTRGSQPVAPVNLNSKQALLEDEGLRMLIASAPFLDGYGYKATQLPYVHLNHLIASPNRRTGWTLIPITANAGLGGHYRSKLLVALLVESPRGACLIGEIEPDPPKPGREQKESRKHFVAGFSLNHSSDARSELAAIASEVVSRKRWPEYDVDTRKFLIPGRSISGERASHLNVTTPQDLAQRIHESILAPLSL
ncbi:MAG: hypothetical protein HYX45_06755 [Burkholderiales bacterium]|nr:hypothetical protein [Burkholderiales bacterium]